MSVKRCLSLLVSVLSLLFCVQICYAAEDNTLLQGYTWENYADLYISGNINTNTVTVDVSNQPAEIIDGGLLTDKDVKIRTTLLLDISASMPKSMRDSVLGYLNNYIETISSNEQLRIVTFGEEIIVLQDFTSDRYDLSKAVSEIKFEGQQSMIYDAVYNTMPRIGANNDNDAPCYYRTIVITDGADESVSGITKEELYLKLQESFYPVEVLSVSDSEKDPVEKNLTALSRISGGRCITMRPGADVTSLDFRLEGITWIRVKVPETVLDGSTRQFNIKDENNTLQFDFKVPIFISETIEQTEEQAEETENESKTEIVTEKETIDSNMEIEDDFGFSMLNPVVIGAIIISIVIIAILVIVLFKKRKEKVFENGQNAVSPFGGTTEMLSSGTMIRLRKMDDPDKIWNLVLSEEIQVGRESSCQVFIDEGSVSRLQCVIYADNSGIPMIENRSNSNPTQVNKIKIASPQQLTDGDQIKCGRVVLMVDSITIESSAGGKGINRMTEFVNV
jgi:hypothetical protein